MLGFIAALAIASHVAVALADLISDLNGQNVRVVTPGTEQYIDASRAFNLRFSFQPAAIAYPRTAQEVSTAVRLGAQYNYKVVARSGGHSYIANGLGGKSGSLLVDMSNFKSITFDSNTQIASIGSGNRLGDIAVALNTYGRGIPHGTCPYVGIGGHSGYGGYGFTSRMWGLTLDVIDSLEVVLANGTITTASSSSYPDLFWALRGSSPSFGIVTNIRVRTFPVPAQATIFEYAWDSMTAAQGVTALTAFQEFSLSSNIPKEWSGAITIASGWRRGNIWFQISGGWYANVDRLDGIMSPLLSKLPAYSSKKFTTGSYIKSVQYLGGLDGGRLNTSAVPDDTDTFYAKSLMTPQASPMSTQARTAFINYLANDAFGANSNWWLQIELYGGANSAINSVPLQSTSFGRRNSLFTMQLYTSSQTYQPPFPQQGYGLLDGMVNSIVNNSPTGWDYGAYANYIDDRLTDWQTRYYGSQASRLLALRDQYDPKDTFSLPVTI